MAMDVVVLREEGTNGVYTCRLHWRGVSNGGVSNGAGGWIDTYCLSFSGEGEPSTANLQ